MSTNFTIQQLSTLNKCETWNARFYTIFNKNLHKVLSTDKQILINELNPLLLVIRPFITFDKVKFSINKALSDRDINLIEKLLSDCSLNTLLDIPSDRYNRIATIFDYILTSEKYLDIARNSYKAIEEELKIKLANLKSAQSYLFKDL